MTQEISKGPGIYVTITTGKQICRNKFDVLSIPEIIIQHINQLCINEKKRVSREPLFEIGTNRRVLEDTTDYNIEDNEAELLNNQMNNK